MSKLIEEIMKHIGLLIAMLVLGAGALHFKLTVPGASL